MKRVVVCSIFWGLLFTISSCKKKKDDIASKRYQGLSVSGTKIVDSSGVPVNLRGVAFGNEVWSDKEIPDKHHGEIDYLRVAEMGMNVVRFYLNYKTFESDGNPYQYKQAGWNWIDQNIMWAKKNGIYLILNMHVPQGGFQSQGNGDALWTGRENQNRLASLWKAIASRYKNEQTVVGYGLVNEPVPNTDLLQWNELAQRLTNEIRTVDKNHILFIERAIYVKTKAESSDYNFPRINDDKTVYEFHIYDPFLYTHQLFSWANVGEGGKYPDETLLTVGATEWYTAIFNNPVLGAGFSDWQYFEGIKYRIADPNIKVGLPALVAEKVGGRVYFDEIEIKEFDPAGNFTRIVSSFSLNDNNGWSYWSKNNTGTFSVSNTTGVSGNKSLLIEGSSDDCNASNYSSLFEPKQNHFYQINGWMKGENVAALSGCRLRIDFLKTNEPIYKRNKSYLESTLKRYSDWGKLNNVPIYMGEFGAGIHCFENNKGGLQWVSDMIDIAKANNFYFTYHTYHEDNFGLYFGYGSLPDPSKANKPLIELMKIKLK